ncbi:gas vesicle protein GvpG [Geotalea uraniireducens]|uniref:Gas vesicle G n=1 Tax=Geotalea uraniireducens (strain Rf4) TaxID=351605 RepID=A5G5D6_GEOUR|nr:gas vesicle protein GvpG [Geotalea uraniireducens]ABQ27004.1 Gas vesicle G [Geotalea uraniireducens Rf4]
MIFLLDDILLSPIKGLVWVADKLKDMAESEMTDDSRIHEELLELQMRFELDEMTEEEYLSKEAELMARLEEIMERKEEL